MYKQRRMALMAKCKENSSVFVFSGYSPMRSADEGYPFSVDRNFYYLTGLDREDMILHVEKIGGTVVSTLFILPFDPVQARWVGGRISKEEAKKIAQVDQVLDFGSFEDVLAQLYNRRRSMEEYHVYLDLWRYRKNQADTEAMKLASKIQKNYPSWRIFDLFPMITKMRMIKDENEVAEIIRANEITRDGVVAMMKNIGDGKCEMEMEGTFLFELMKQGCKNTAFQTIAASGKNATILHYSTNSDLCKDGDLFLCDLGATSGYYCADISRTFPVNGKFTERQKQLYNTVLEAQWLVEKNAKPGLTTRQLNQMVIEFYISKLKELNLKEKVVEYYFHGVAHHLGLDTHDVSLLDAPLEPGMVITNEPGLYIAEEGIGIRIEDDLLITEDGCRNLSCTPKTVEEIEEIMKK